ncbi:MAG: DUF3644 domain-containing protein, partial [Firmicutes bacterium]|nr:DUF3644 domain-containing protein [Bacillota bacterium]
MECDSNLIEKLLDKSKEAFILAIEIYNKPSIKYRVEGFSFFICNAWELMLKAHIVNEKGQSAIYYKDNPGRTISLENSIRTVFTNEYAPIRKNLMRIVELRNTSTHFIVEEYEMVYIPLFQSCIFNYSEKMAEFHSVDVTTIVPQNFLMLAVSYNSLNAAEIRAKYTKPVAKRLLAASEAIKTEIDENNSAYAIRIEHHHYLTKNKNEAAETFRLDKSSKNGVRIIKEIKDPNETFKFNAKKCVKEINNRLARSKVQMMYKGVPTTFNTFHFDLFN